MEELFQYLWKYRLFDSYELIADNGSKIEIIDVGIQNNNSGPDFFNAKIKVDNTIWAGNVEIHMRSSDWNRHGHDKDKMYDSVILNVVETKDAIITRTNGEVIPQLVVKVPDDIREHYSHLLNNSPQIPCIDQLKELDIFQFSSWKDRLLVERLERKTENIRYHLENCNQNWEEVFFVTFLRSFGLGVNNDAFERLARSLSLVFLQKHANSLLQIEAMLFGQAGFLSENRSDNSYYTLLKREYELLKHKFSLSPIEREAWRYLRMRPANFPQVRLAQIASIYHKTPLLFSRIIDINSVGDFSKIMEGSPSPYWESHYDFDKESEPRTKKIGSTANQILMINAVLPMMFAYGKAFGREELCDKAFELYEQIPEENNLIVRNWKNVGIKIACAADSQAILQLQKEYCENKKCLYCRIGHRILSRK